MSNPASFEETVRNALFQDGDAVFLICYLHAKREEETVALMREVFWALGAHRQPFSSDRERRVWLYKAAHRAAMDYYAKKYRRNPSSATVRRWGESFPFEVSEELAAVLLLHYPLLTPAALCYGCGEKPEVIAKVTGRPLGLTKRRLKAALEKSGLPRHEMREWLATVTQKGAASFQRGFRRVAPFLALGVLALALTAALAVRLNWFRLTPPAPSPSETETAPAPDAPSSPSVSSETQPESAPQESDPPGEASSQLPENIARFDVAIFLPNETGLTQYNARNVPADAGCIVQEMAARGLGRAVKADQRDFYRDQLSRLGLGLEDRLTDRIGLLSGGQRQAVSLLMAALQPSRILLLDEHTAALDPRTADFVLELTQRIVTEKQLTTMMVTHSMRQALDVGDRTVMLHQGQVVLDVSGEQRKGMQIPDLLDMFEKVRGEKISDDALLLG